MSFKGRTDIPSQQDLRNIDRQIRDLRELAFGNPAQPDKILQKQSTEKKKSLPPPDSAATTQESTPVLQGKPAQ